MKKITVLILALICVLSVAGCTSPQDPIENKNIDEQPNDVTPNEWGITLKAENVTASGLTIVCAQSGGEDVAELDTGSYYVIQREENDEWVDVEFLPQEYDIAWTSEAWIIQKESETTWDVNWEWLYGQLPAGEYRIGKEIMNFRETGDYDKETVYAEFMIE